jgi:hypothetical protein
LKGGSGSRNYRILVIDSGIKKAEKIALNANCQHQIVSCMRSGPDVSASCIKCWKPVFKTKEVVIWKYGLVGYREKKPEGTQQVTRSLVPPPCEHKILKVYRSDRYVAARCLNCDTLLSSLSEMRLVKNSIIKPRIEIGAAVVRGKQKIEPSSFGRTAEIAST